MRSFLQKSRAQGAYQQAKRGVRVLDTPCYQEFENPLNDGTFGIVYVIRRDDSAYVVCACMPDDIASTINDYIVLNPRNQRSALGMYQETWPLLATLRSNGTTGQHFPAALTAIKDPDYGIKRWAVATEVGNLRALSSTGMLETPRLVEALVRVSDFSEALIRQVSTSKMDPDRWRTARWRDGLQEYVKIATKFIDDNAEPIVKVIKLLDA